MNIYIFIQKKPWCWYFLTNHRGQAVAETGKRIRDLRGPKGGENVHGDLHESYIKGSTGNHGVNESILRLFKGSWKRTGPTSEDNISCQLFHGTLGDLGVFLCFLRKKQEEGDESNGVGRFGVGRLWEVDRKEITQLIYRMSCRCSKSLEEKDWIWKLPARFFFGKEVQNLPSKNIFRCQGFSEVPWLCPRGNQWGHGRENFVPPHGTFRLCTFFPGEGFLTSVLRKWLMPWLDGCCLMVPFFSKMISLLDTLAEWFYTSHVCRKGLMPSLDGSSLWFSQSRLDKFCSLNPTFRSWNRFWNDWLHQ